MKHDDYTMIVINEELPTLEYTDIYYGHTKAEQITQKIPMKYEHELAMEE